MALIDRQSGLGEEWTAFDTICQIIDMKHSSSFYIAFTAEQARIKGAPKALTEFSMAVQRTFSIIKPDATKRNITGKVNAKIEEAGLRIIAQKRVQLTEEQAGGFYAVHKERPFYGDLVKFMMSGPVVVQVLEGENAIKAYRDVMGATNPSEAAAGTIRAEFAESIDANTVHGSDAPETAIEEIAFFFSEDEIVG